MSQLTSTAASALVAGTDAAPIDRQLPPIETHCFHCGTPVPLGVDLSVTWDGEARPMCCRGCQAVAQAIVDNRLDDYYRFRTETVAAPRELIPSALQELVVYDHPSVQQQFVRRDGARCEAALLLEGIACSACVWLTEQQLQRVAGVVDVQVNYATRRARVSWDATRTQLSEILKSIEAIGYRAHPYDPARSQQLLVTERRTLLRRLGVAGLFGAQTMILSEALYGGDWAGSDPSLRTLFLWLSLLLTLPVLCYSALPFLKNAWNDLTHKRAGMDVPVALGLIGAFIASAWTTVTGSGTAYYDAVTMLAFLLLGARYFEHAARMRATQAVELLAQSTPAFATRITANATDEQVPVAELVPGDVIRARPGETIAADGRVVTGCSSVNESLLTGESLPITKTVGARVIGGSINVESPLTIRVDRIGTETVMSSMLRLIDRAQSEKSSMAQIADRVGAWFVLGLLVVTALTALYWWQHDSTRVLPVVVALLVVTCPCALALATPAAIAAATGNLTRRGLLTTRAHALETLARATHVVLDKTGTLTKGELLVATVRPLAGELAPRCLMLAAALEQHSEHPIARAILAATTGPMVTAVDVINTPGEGLCGTISGRRYYLGTPAFIEKQAGFVVNPYLLKELREGGATTVVLATSLDLIAIFSLKDTLRPGAAALVETLTSLGKKVLLLTGDNRQAAFEVARALGIREVHADLMPAAKLHVLQELQSKGAVVAALGDGVNDAPLLTAAHVSIAMGGAAQLSTVNADMVLLGNDLSQLAAAVRLAHRTLAIIRQNLAWATIYNALAIPAAIAGIVTPWLAALGMSISSLVVLANALRLAGKRQEGTSWK